MIVTKFLCQTDLHQGVRPPLAVTSEVVSQIRWRPGFLVDFNLLCMRAVSCYLFPRSLLPGGFLMLAHALLLERPHNW